jgi:hypothetical protein
LSSGRDTWRPGLLELLQVVRGSVERVVACSGCNCPALSASEEESGVIVLLEETSEVPVLCALEYIRTVLLFCVEPHGLK